MTAPKHTPGPWYWHTDHAGSVSLRTPDRGNLIVMDFVRKGMNGANPRLAYWQGLPGGAQRERMGGILDTFNAEHPDAALIAAAPELLEALKAIEGRITKAANAFYVSGKRSDLQAAFDGWKVDAQQARAAIAKAEGRV